MDCLLLYSIVNVIPQMKFIVTDDNIDGFSRIYDIDNQEFTTFNSIEDQVYSNELVLDECWKNLPFDISILVLLETINMYMMDGSFWDASEYAFISKTVLKYFCRNWFASLRPDYNYFTIIAAIKRTIYMVSTIACVLTDEQYAYSCDTFAIEFYMFKRISERQRLAGPWDHNGFSSVKRFNIAESEFQVNGDPDRIVLLYKGGDCIKDYFALRTEYVNGIHNGDVVRPFIIIRIIDEQGYTVLQENFNRARWCILSSILKRVFGPYTEVAMICDQPTSNPFFSEHILETF